MLEWQLPLRLGIDATQLRPIDRIADLGAPVLIVAGDRDQHTHVDESRALYAWARPPKALWILPGAVHEDFQARDPVGYDTRVLGFLQRALVESAPNTAHPR